MKRHIIKLKKLEACGEAIEYAKRFDTLQEAWDSCERGDWMLWLISKSVKGPRSQSRKKLVLVACACARLSLKYVAKGEKRPLKAIQTAEKWAKGDMSVSLTDVENAADAADAAATYAATYAVAYAAADDADYAAYATTYTADAVADAAYATAVDVNAAYAAADYARSKILKKCADIARKYYPKI